MPHLEQERFFCQRVRSNHSSLNVYWHYHSWLDVSQTWRVQKLVPKCICIESIVLVKLLLKWDTSTSNLSNAANATAIKNISRKKHAEVLKLQQQMNTYCNQILSFPLCHLPTCRQRHWKIQEENLLVLRYVNLIISWGSFSSTTLKGSPSQHFKRGHFETERAKWRYRHWQRSD